MSETADYSDIAEPESHALTHKSGGSDEVDVTGLTPADHASRHELGGADVIDVTGLVGSGSYVDRGDPAAFDFQIGDLTLDGDMYDLNLSSIAPANTIIVHLRVAFQDVNEGTSVLFRKKGNSNEINLTILRMQVGGVTVDGDLWVACDSSRVIQYKCQGLAPSVFDITVRGWIVLY